MENAIRPAVGLLALCCLGILEAPLAVSAQMPEGPGDFNRDGAVDFRDFSLFLGAFGGANPVYDLNGNGKVGFADLLIFSRRYGRQPAPEPGAIVTPVGPDPLIFPHERGAQSPLVPNFSYRASSDAVFFAFADYRLTLSYGDPFGIAALRLQGQEANFANPEALSFGTTGIIADWEWFKIGQGDQEQWFKLIKPVWRAPAIEFYADRVLVRFLRSDVLVRGVQLIVEFSFEIERPAFAVRYAIRNQSDRPLPVPYTMTGFPGFTNYGQITAVETQLERRQPLPPHDNFLAEAAAQDEDQYRLLRHDVRPRLGESQPLRGAVELAEAGRIWILET